MDIGRGREMEQSHGRPATKIEVEAFTAIANLQDENRELKLKIQRLEDELDQKEAERLAACDQRNIAYAEAEELRADGLMLDWIERQIGRPVSLLPLVIQDVMRGKSIREAIERARG